MLALRGLPGIYFHSLFGSRGDRRGAEESGIPRRINRKKLDFAELQAELSAKESFRGRVFAGLRRMIEARASHPAFSPYAGQIIPEAPPGLFVAIRSASDGRKVLCITNVTAEPISYSLPASGGSEWTALAEFPAPTSTGRDAELPRYGVSWFAAT